VESAEDCGVYEISVVRINEKSWREERVARFQLPPDPLGPIAFLHNYLYGLLEPSISGTPALTAVGLTHGVLETPPGGTEPPLPEDGTATVGG